MNAFIITGANSGVGKTTVTNALMSIFDNVEPFKIGPDFIDPNFHKFVTNRPSHNLDFFMYEKETIEYIFNRNNKENTTKIVEGVMGLYGGKTHELDNSSTAHTSRLLNLPVVLIVNGKGKDTSLAAEVLGYLNFDKRVNIVGVIINKVTKGSYQYLKSAIEMHTPIKCLGYLPLMEEIAINERHLGLLQASEIEDLAVKIEKLKEVAKETINIKAIKKLTKYEYNKDVVEIDKSIIDIHKGKTVAIAKDEAFTFTYDIHIELFEKSGASIKYFSPLHDKVVPESDLIIFPGGYPELHLEKLSSNKEMINDIKDKVSKNTKVLAECGGFIYLSKNIKKDNQIYDLCNIFDIEIEMHNRLNMKRFGYLDIKYNDLSIKGHEFHYSDIKVSNETNQLFDIVNKNYKCGFNKNEVLAGYPHILYYSNLEFFKQIFNRRK